MTQDKTAQDTIAGLLPPGVDAQPLPARFGQLGLCSACREPAVSHFNTVGRFVGCKAVPEGTTFVLTAVLPGEAAILPDRRIAAQNDPQTAPRPPRHARRFRRARWHTTVSRKTLPTLDLGASDQRPPVLKALIDAGPAGALSREICIKTGLTNSQVGQVLSWLQAHQLAEARKIEPD